MSHIRPLADLGPRAASRRKRIIRKLRRKVRVRTAAGASPYKIERVSRLIPLLTKGGNLTPHPDRAGHQREGADALRAHREAKAAARRARTEAQQVQQAQERQARLHPLEAV